jgi:hypothetical protein
MNSSYDNDRNWNDDGPISPALAALLSNLPDLTRLVLAGVGRVEACCIVDYVRPAVIEKMLPPGLSLKLPKAKPPEALPICLVFSEQRQVRPGFVPFGGISYMEFSIIFHDVYNLDTNDDYNGPFVYMPRMLLNSLPPVAVGVVGYGSTNAWRALVASAILSTFETRRAKYLRVLKMRPCLGRLAIFQNSRLSEEY